MCPYKQILALFLLFFFMNAHLCVFAVRSGEARQDVAAPLPGSVPADGGRKRDVSGRHEKHLQCQPQDSLQIRTQGVYTLSSLTECMPVHCQTFHM